MVGHGGSSAGSYLANPTSPIPSHCASIVATNTLRVNRMGLETKPPSLPKALGIQVMIGFVVRFFSGIFDLMVCFNMDMNMQPATMWSHDTKCIRV